MIVFDKFVWIRIAVSSLIINTFAQPTCYEELADWMSFCAAKRENNSEMAIYEKIWKKLEAATE